MNRLRNEKCYKENAAEKSPPLVQNGKVIFQTHHIGWVVAGLFAIVATVVSFWLVNKHLRWYTNKGEQRYIVRILFMVPLYALISFASYLFWNHSTALLLLRDGYESTVLTAFFYLLLTYLSPDPEEQKAIFSKLGLSRNADREATKKGEELKKWVFPLGFIRSKPQDGLYFLQLMKWGVLQYCIIRPTTTLVAVILDYQGLYCEESWGLGWGHIYITSLVSISVTVAMYCLIQLYVPVSMHLSSHKPLLKLFAIKAVVFLTFWQSTFLSLLSLFGVVKATKYMTAGDINISIGALLETFEMMIFAFLHIFAFTYKPYVPSNPPKPRDTPTSTPRVRALAHAMDFRETFREIWVGCVYICDKLRGKEPTPDINAKRAVHYEGAFGMIRPPRLAPNTRSNLNPDARMDKIAPVLPVLKIEVEEHVDVEGERQWLGTGNDHGYGLAYIKRERSEGLEVQIEKELEKRGYVTRLQAQSQINLTRNEGAAGQRRKHSWWHSAYRRISQPSPDTEDLITGDLYRPAARKHSDFSFNMPLTKTGLLRDYEHGLDKSPPQHACYDQNYAQPGSLEMHCILETDQHNILVPQPAFQDLYLEDTLLSPPNSSNPPSSSKPPTLGHPAPCLPGVSLSHNERSDNLLGRSVLFSVKDVPTGTPLHYTIDPHTPNLPSHQESRSVGTTLSSPSPPRNRVPPSQHRWHLRESAQHYPPLHSRPIPLVTTPVPFPATNMS